MSIGRIDSILFSSTTVCVCDVVLETCRRFWPLAVFQDVASLDIRSLTDPWLWLEGTASREFFVYQDANAAESWDQLGAVPQNSNTMIHVLIRDRPVGHEMIREVTVVCDKLTDEMSDLVLGIKFALEYTLLDAGEERIAA